MISKLIKIASSILVSLFLWFQINSTLVASEINSLAGCNFTQFLKNSHLELTDINTVESYQKFFIEYKDKELKHIVSQFVKKDPLTDKLVIFTNDNRQIFAQFNGVAKNKNGEYFLRYTDENGAKEIINFKSIDAKTTDKNLIRLELPIEPKADSTNIVKREWTINQEDLKKLSFEKKITKRDSEWSVVNSQQVLPMPKFASPIKSITKLKPKLIKFMQSWGSNWTKDGKFTVLENALKFVNKALDPSSLPPIRIWRDTLGRVWTLDHRRLASYRLANFNRPIKVTWATMQEVLNESFKMQTVTNGETMILKITAQEGLIVK